jgi:hypothetical protein
VRKHHASHFHPFVDRISGNDFDLFSAPEPEDYVAATNSYLEIIMYATDDDGLTTETSRNVYPSLVYIDVDSGPQGLQVLVDEYPIVTPQQVASWEGHNLRLRVEDQPPNQFASWSDGNNAREHSMELVENSSSAILATFCLDSKRCAVGLCQPSISDYIGGSRQKMSETAGRGGAANRARESG